MTSNLHDDIAKRLQQLLADFGGCSTTGRTAMLPTLRSICQEVNKACDGEHYAASKCDQLVGNCEDMAMTYKPDGYDEARYLEGNGSDVYRIVTSLEKAAARHR